MPASPQLSSTQALGAAVAVCCGQIADLLTGLAMVRGELGAGAALAIHLSLVTAIVAIAFRLWAADPAIAVIGGFAMLTTGPAGVLAAGLAWLRLRTSAGSRDGVPAQVRRIPSRDDGDVAAQISDAISEGRAARPASRPPAAFHRVVEEGTFDEGQALLGLIGLRYHPDYFPLLQKALKSRRSGLRVQAAAVHTKLRAHYAERLRHTLAQPHAAATDETGAAAVLKELGTCIASGFLDPSESKAASENARAIALALAQRGDALPSALRRLVIETFAQLGDHQALIDLIGEDRSDACEEIRRHRACALMHLGRHREIGKLSSCASTAPVPRWRPELRLVPSAPTQETAA